MAMLPRWPALRLQSLFSCGVVWVTISPTSLFLQVLWKGSPCVSISMPDLMMVCVSGPCWMKSGPERCWLAGWWPVVAQRSGKCTGAGVPVSHECLLFPTLPQMWGQELWHDCQGGQGGLRISGIKTRTRDKALWGKGSLCMKPAGIPHKVMQPQSQPSWPLVTVLSSRLNGSNWHFIQTSQDSMA